MLVLLLLGFSSGLPIALTGSTLQGWMQSEGVDLAVIGLFSLVGLPYALKFLWSPVMDRYVPPFLGRRRGWLVVTQLAIILAVMALGFTSPREHIEVTAALALLVAFFSASQDIVADAYRTDLLHTVEIGPGSAIHITGYRLAMIASGALGLMLADYLPWRVVYLLMGGAMLIGVLTSILAPEPELPPAAPRTLREAYGLPLVEFFRRRGALEILAFTLFYKLDAVMTIALQTAFVMQLGFSKTEIGLVTKGFGLTATLLGTMAGGALMIKLGLKRSLWVFGITQAAAGLSYLGLSLAGHSHGLLVVAIAVENACSGMGNSAYAAFMLSQCDRRFSATQYALFSSLMAITRNVLASPAGFLASGLGWPMYYLVCIFASTPAFLLLLRYDRWQGHMAEA